MRLEKFEGNNIHFRTVIGSGSAIGKNTNLPSKKFRYFMGSRGGQCKKDNNYYNDSTLNNKYYL